MNIFKTVSAALLALMFAAPVMADHPAKFDVDAVDAKVIKHLHESIAE